MVNTNVIVCLLQFQSKGSKWTEYSWNEIPHKGRHIRTYTHESTLIQLTNKTVKLIHIYNMYTYVRIYTVHIYIHTM